ncbi:MAG: hypothetical protein ABR497_09735 [Kiritimatiellia bacterium]|nr:hypothetical protein [Lentisphaerota bacterium]
MTEREKLQLCYELAFFPPRLNEVAYRIRKGEVGEDGELGELLDTALLLHMALPEKGYSSQRALTRLANYQAMARAFGMVGFIRRLRRELARKPLTEHEVPGRLVRDIGLPPFARRKPACQN